MKPVTRISAPNVKQPLLLFALCAGLCILFSHAAGAACASGDTSCDTCISGAMFNDPSFGQNLINTMFTIINNVIGTTALNFYSNTVGNTDFREFVDASVIVYFATYGAMIVFGIIPVRAYDVSVRLMKVAFIFSLIGTTSGYTFFLQWVGGPFIRLMNELIVLFNNVGTGSNVPAAPIGPGGTLDPNALAIIEPAITQVFSIQYITSILSLAVFGNFGWLIACIMIWALKDFALMLIGAVFTYTKAIIALAFLFGIAPVFFVFILFEKTRQAFLGWFKQVLSFSFQPVLLFAFLAFYIGLITSSLNNIAGNATAGIAAPDYCYVKWFSLPGGLWDVSWWRPVDGNGVPISGDANGAIPNITMFSAMYFMLLCHLGYSFFQYIEALAGDITGGITVGGLNPDSISRWTSNNLMGGRSAAGAAGSAASSGVKWLTRPGL